MRLGKVWLMCSSCILLTACGTQPIKPSDKHIQREAGSEATTSANIPQPIKRTIPLPPPTATPKAETYSVIVTNVPVQEILFALARDAKINLDIHTGIQGAVTLNAIDQTLPQILSRIAKQVEMRYELDGTNLIIMPDAPYLKHYKIDYVNMSRDAEGGISNTTQVGGGGTGAGAATGGTGNNNSQLAIKNTSKNHFWDTLTQNIKDILRETDKILPSGSSETSVQQSSAISTTGTGAQPPAGSKKSTAKQPGIENSPNPAFLQEGGTTVTRTSTFQEKASVIANPESGIITVRATGKQHEKIQEFIDQIMTSARRQVLIEATIVEVRLNDNYQQGIDWHGIAIGGKGFTVKQLGTGLGQQATNNGSMFNLSYINPLSKFGDIKAAVTLLESFGTVKVLSSPKLSVINNQTAILRVVDNLAYFNVTALPGTAATAISAATATTFTTNLMTSPVGFTMIVTPQINDSDTVLLNVRPSITRFIRYINDPNPSLANPCGIGVANCNIPAIPSQIPETSTREMESVLKVENNQIAVLGGLMEDRIDNFSDEVPGLSKIPLVGNFFKNRNDTSKKTELVIFLRPVVIKDASVNGDYGEFRDSLPNSDFFKEPNKNPEPNKNQDSSKP